MNRDEPGDTQPLFVEDLLDSVNRQLYFEHRVRFLREYVKTLRRQVPEAGHVAHVSREDLVQVLAQTDFMLNTFEHYIAAIAAAKPWKEGEL